MMDDRMLPDRSEEPVRRLAALGDFHCDAHTDSSELREALARASQEADVLLFLGGMTTHGERDHAEAFVRHLDGVDVPMLAVLGNHDHECDQPEVVCEILESAGVRVLDGDAVTIGRVGFVGVKGFGGGFGGNALAPFGEQAMKAFVDAAGGVELKLERALAGLRADCKVVLLHYAPVPSTMGREPEQIWPFLASSRLVRPVEDYGADVVFHGHAHIGAPEGRTPGGIPVFNVALPVLREEGLTHRTWDVESRSVPGTFRGD